MNVSEMEGLAEADVEPAVGWLAEPVSALGQARLEAPAGDLSGGGAPRQRLVETGRTPRGGGRTIDVVSVPMQHSCRLCRKERELRENRVRGQEPQ